MNNYLHRVPEQCAYMREYAKTGRVSPEVRINVNRKNEIPSYYPRDVIMIPEASVVPRVAT